MFLKAQLFLHGPFVISIGVKLLRLSFGVEITLFYLPAFGRGKKSRVLRSDLRF